MRARSLLAATAAVLAVVAPQAGAHPGHPHAPQVKDAAGDANGVNAQGQAAPAPFPDAGVPTAPASYGAADIMSVGWASTIVKKKVTGYTITLTLAAAPASAITYRIESTSPTCASLWAEYRVDPTGAAKTSMRCAADQVTYKIPNAVVKGATITWTVPLAALGKPYKAGLLLDGLGAQTRGFVWLAGQTVPVPVLGNTTGATVPQLDHAVSTAAFKIGS